MYIVNYWGHKPGINIETDLRSKLFAHIQKHHQELLAAGGVYSRLHQAQFGH